MRLHASVAAALAASVLLCAFIVAVIGWQLHGEIEPMVRERLLGTGLSFVAQQVEAAEPSQREDVLQAARASLEFPLALRPDDAVPPRVRQASTSTLTGRPPEDALLYIPIDGGAQYLVAGPLKPPPAPPVGLLAVMLLVLIATASVAVSWPLARRIRRLQRALNDIGRGQWAKRIDEDEGALADLAHSINYALGELQTLFQEREALLQAVSHEMGTPVSRMRFQVELLETEATSTQRKRLVALRDDLDELDQLSSELVGWMEADSRRLSTTRFALEPALASLLELESYETNLPKDSALHVPEDAFVVADQRQFLRAMENLLRNALRYARTQVIVEARAVMGSVEIDVRDDGPGIPPEQRTRVLEPFVRVDESRARDEGGLGLGLAIVRRIVESHGGTIEIDEAVEGGARISTRWPVEPVPRRDPTGSFEPEP